MPFVQNTAGIPESGWPDGIPIAGRRQSHGPENDAHGQGCVTAVARHERQQLQLGQHTEWAEASGNVCGLIEMQ